MDLPKRRKDLSLNEKIALLKRYDSLPEMSQRNAALRLDISQPLLCKILKSREELEDKVRRNKYLCPETNRGHHRYRSESLQRASLNDLPQFPEDLSVQVINKKHSFAISDDWSGAVPPDERQTVVSVPAVEAWVRDEWPKLLTRYTLKNIYKADETVIYYRALPTYTYLFRNELMDGNEVAKKRLSVMCCVDMLGGKRRLSVIGKNDIEGECSLGLPVDYTPVPNPTITSSIFNEWLSRWDSELEHEVLLVVEKSPVHVISSPLKFVRVLPLSASIVSLIQPSSQVIVKELKCHYRESLRLKASENEQKQQQQSLSEMSEKNDLLEILHLLGSAWDRVLADTVRKSFTQSPKVTKDMEKKSLQLIMHADGLVNTDLPLDMSAKKTKVFGAAQHSESTSSRKESKPCRSDAAARASKARASSAFPEDFRMSRPGADCSSGNTSPKMMLLKRKQEQITPQVLPSESTKPVDKTSVSLVPPIRQTASIFKQSVTIVKPQKSTVRTDMMYGVQEKPKQLFWEKRLQGLSASEGNGRKIECFELPKKVRAVGLQLSDDTILRSIATALHLNSLPITGQNKPKPLLDKNPGVYINPNQPLVLGVHVTDEDIEEQEKKVEHARQLLRNALEEHKF